MIVKLQTSISMSSAWLLNFPAYTLLERISKNSKTFQTTKSSNLKVYRPFSYLKHSDIFIIRRTLSTNRNVRFYEHLEFRILTGSLFANDIHVFTRPFMNVLFDGMHTLMC